MQNNEEYIEFLIKEYEECYKQLKFYDERMERIIKYLFVILYASLISIYYISKDLNFNLLDKKLIIIITMISGFDFLSSVFILLSLIKNRIYFVIVAKQINSIRDYFVSKIDNFHNQMYISTNINFFKLTSIHSLKLLGVFLLSIFYFFTCITSIDYLITSTLHISSSIIITIIFVIMCLVLFFCYVEKLKYKNADELVHEKK